MALRAIGHNLRVKVIVFMKGDYPYGEWKALEKFTSAHIARFGFREFTDPANIKAEEKEQARLALAAAREAVSSGDYDLVVLDEVNVAAAWKLIELEDLMKIIREKPAGVELVLTGRYADKKLIEVADLVTECNKIKHPYDQGMLARSGIDY